MRSNNMTSLKYRYKTWYWGKYTTISEIKKEKWNINDFEIYDEEIHGWHNSDEYKLEQRG